MKWNGRSYRPANAQIISKKKPFDFQEALKPYGEKNVPVWGMVANVYKEPAGGGGFDPSYQSIISYATAQGYTVPPLSAQTLQNQMVLDLKSDGLWTKLDIFYLFEQDDSTSSDLKDFARINWKNPSSFEIIESGTTTYSNNLGFQGKTTAPQAWLNTTFKPLTNGTGFTQNDASVIWYSNSLGISNSIYFGNVDNSVLRATQLNTNSHRLNANATLSSSVDLVKTGTTIMTRADASTVKFYNNGVEIASRTQTADALHNSDVTIFRQQTSYGSEKLSAFGMGANMTSGDSQNINTILFTYFDQVEPEPSPTPSITPTRTPTRTPTPTPSSTSSPSPTPTTTPTNTPSITPSLTPTITVSSTPTNTPTPSSTPPALTGQTEAQTYMAAVIAGGGTLDSTMSGATYQLFNDLFVAGLWTKLYSFYPLLGGNSSGGQAVNGKTPGTRNMTWNGGLTFSTNGVVSNGSTGWGNTNCNGNTVGGLDDFHMSFYSRTDQQVSLTQFDMGVYQDPNQRTQLNSRSTSDDTRGVVNATTQGTYSNTNSQGMFTISRRSSTDTEIYKNDTSLGNSSVTSTARPNGVIGLCVRYWSVSDLISTPTTRQYAFVTMGNALSDSEVTDLYDAIQTFQTTLGRQV